jgi:hypothetical protein
MFDVRLFRVFSKSLMELNWYGDFHSFWFSYTSLSTEQFNAIIKLIVEGVLECNNFSGKCAALLAKASSRGKHICSAILYQGGLPCLISSVSTLLTPGAKASMSDESDPDSAVNYFCCNCCAIIANIIRFLPSRLTSELILSCNGLLLLVRLTCSGWEAVVGDTVPFAEHVNCSREGVQALANLAILANEKVWKELLSSKCVTAFSAVVTGALLDLNKAQQGVPASKNKMKSGKLGLTFSTPDSELEKKWQDSFATLEVGVSALARVMEICPLAFSKEIAATPLMAQLQKIFKMDVLPSSLRTNTAFILYSMTCAKDAEASKLLQDGVTRSAIKDILQEHELTLNPGGDRYPWTLEQLFAYVSRGLVAWAGSVGSDLKVAKGSDRGHLVITCSARMPRVVRPSTSPYTMSTHKVVGADCISEDEDDLGNLADPPIAFTFDSLL